MIQMCNSVSVYFYSFKKEFIVLFYKFNCFLFNNKNKTIQLYLFFYHEGYE